MECKDILNLIAIVAIPIAAVLIGQYLQNRAEIRKDKMQIFKTLMTSRTYGWTQESVHCLNIIDIVFADDKTVRDACICSTSRKNISSACWSMSAR